MTLSANDVLMGGGITSAKFDKPGDSVTGTIHAEPQARQQTDFTTGEPLTWANGDPRMQVIVTLATEARTSDDDDGLRNVYIKGKSLTAAVREAVRRTGAPGLEKGGQLTVTYEKDGVAEKRGLNPPKLYTASYVPPSAAAVNAVLDQPEQEAQPAPQTATVDPAALAAALGNLPPEVIAAIKAQAG